jgi:hypothetical protein
MKGYHMNIFYSEEDGGYIADIPDLHHCSAFGELQESPAPYKAILGHENAARRFQNV